MKVCRLRIANFRGVKSAIILLPKHAVLIGDNNTGKTALFEALDLVLGPDRLNRQPPIDEHDFFQGSTLPWPLMQVVKRQRTRALTRSRTLPSRRQPVKVARARRRRPRLAYTRRELRSKWPSPT
ncbi:MAG: AAA family ATPase [Rhodospirillales bacterium]|nr:AAA family ATPase [Rhodospirillales bacterium]